MKDRHTQAAIYVTLPLSAAMLATAVLVSLAGGMGGLREDERPYQQIDLLTRTMHLIENEYIEDVDSWDLVFEALGTMTRRDPYSSFYTPDRADRFTEETQREYHGVGFSVHADAPPLVIDYLFPGAPAEEAGLDAGDQIVAIDDVDSTQMTVEQATSRIKGPLGTRVKLTVQRGGEQHTVELARSKIQTPTVFQDHFQDDPADGVGPVGYVRISGFGDHTAEEFDRALENLPENCRGLVLDLRFNQGGLVESCRTVANRFLESGVIVGIRHRDESQNISFHADPDECRFAELPLVVLVNGDTASAAEIVAGALQDHSRAMLVGTRTYGKGVVQSIYPLTLDDEEGRKVVVKLTTGEYLTPGGRVIEKAVKRSVPVRGGLEPDVRIRLAESTERALARRFELFRVPARYRDYYLRAYELTLPEPPDRVLEAALALLDGETVVQDLADD